MADILWDTHEVRSRSVNDHDITITKYKRMDGAQKFGITFRNGVWAQISNTQRIVVGISQDGTKIYFRAGRTDTEGFLLSSPKTKKLKPNSSTRYGTFYPKENTIKGWMQQNQGDYYLNFDVNGNPYITNEDNVQRIIWAQRSK